MNTEVIEVLYSHPGKLKTDTLSACARIARTTERERLLPVNVWWESQYGYMNLLED